MSFNSQKSPINNTFESIYLNSLIEEIDPSKNDIQMLQNKMNYCKNNLNVNNTLNIEKNQNNLNINNQIQIQKNYNFNKNLFQITENSIKNLIESPNLSFIINKEILNFILSNQFYTIEFQKKLKNFNQIEINNFFEILSGEFLQIMNNKNGNYLCTDFFKLLKSNQRIRILLEIYSKIDDISIHNFGTHSMQTLVELSETNEEISLILSVFLDINKVIKVAFNSNGSFVIQKILIKFPEIQRKNLNFLLLNIFPKLAVDMHGVIVARYLVQYSFDEDFSKKILKSILDNFLFISQNKYGNYLIQFVLGYWWNLNFSLYLKQIISKNFIQLSTNQFSSHITKCYIQLLTNKEKKELLYSLIYNNLYNILENDKYGVYVINKLNYSLTKNNL